MIPLPEPYATTEALKDRVRACTSATALNATVWAIAAEAKAHELRDPGGIVQLRNLITYQRTAIARGWVRFDKQRGAA